MKTYQVEGDMDAATMEDLKPLFEEIAACEEDVQLDLGQVSFIDSSGIGGLVFLFKRLKMRSHSMTIANAKGSRTNCSCNCALVSCWRRRQKRAPREFPGKPRSLNLPSWGKRVLGTCFSVMARQLSRLGQKRVAAEKPIADVAPLAILDPAAPPVEAVHQHVAARRARIVGIVGVAHDSGVTTLVHALAARCAQGGQRTLVIDCSGRACDSDQRGPDLLGGGAIAATKLHEGGYDTLLLRPPSHEMLRVRSVSWLRQLMVGELGGYQMIFVDMLPARENPEYALPATIVGNACDIVLMMCLAARATKADLEEAVTTMRTVGAPLGGVVVNRREQPTLGFEIAREARRFARIAPGLSRTLEQKALNSKFLDVHA